MSSDAPDMKAAYGRPQAMAWNIGTIAAPGRPAPRPNASAVQTCIECR